MVSSTPNKSSASLNPRTTTYEFLGPPGALAMSIGVPLLAYALYFGSTESTPPLSAFLSSFLEALSSRDFWLSLWDGKAFTLYYAWYTFCLVVWALLPGEWIRGTQLRNGRYQQYKIHALSTALVAIGLAAAYILVFGVAALTFLYDHWVGFTSAALSMAVLQGFLWYALSFQHGTLLALGGNSGNVIYDFYIGHDLNPTVGWLDVKSFNELRPGLILWLLIDISMACEQATRLGGAITDSMVLVVAFQSLLTVSHQPALFTTMDIISDGFGFMLTLGHLLWVPFVYSIQARYLAWHPVHLGWRAALAIVAVKGTGFWIFRVSNNEKHEFRNGRNPKNLRYIATERGSKLLISGWWAVSQHPNYLGDLLMELPWSLPTGFGNPLTYFYVVYFTVLLVHRQRRDDEACGKKYGKDWEKYKRLVPYRIVPYVY